MFVSFVPKFKMGNGEKVFILLVVGGIFPENNVIYLWLRNQTLFSKV